MAHGEAAVGDVEGVPEVVYRTDLSRVTRGELLQDGRHLAEDPPVAVGLHGIVGRVLGVLGVGPGGIGQVERPGYGEPHPNAQDGQRVHDRAVEGGYGLADEREGDLPPVQDRDHQLVRDEVEVDGEDRVAVDLPHGARGGAAPREVQRDVPPVIALNAGGETDLSDDLREPVECLLRVAPLRQRDRREQFHGHPSPPVQRFRRAGQVLGSAAIRPSVARYGTSSHPEGRGHRCAGDPAGGPRRPHHDMAPWGSHASHLRGPACRAPGAAPARLVTQSGRRSPEEPSRRCRGGRCRPGGLRTCSTR